MHTGKGWRRVVVEKPFGHDLASARELSEPDSKVFPEKAVYRIDHYLGKETVQNILAFRFGNGILSHYGIAVRKHVQITAAESIGVEGKRCVLPGSRGAAGHDPKSPAPGDVDGHDGAAHSLRRR